MKYVTTTKKTLKGDEQMFCGYNEEMSKHMKGLLESFITYGILEKSRVKNRSAGESLKIELSDLDRLVSEATRGITDPAKKDLIVGVATFAKGFYSLFNPENITQYKDIAAAVDKFYRAMDNKYYPELETEKEKRNPNDVKLLVQYLDRLSLREK